MRTPESCESHTERQQDTAKKKEKKECCSHRNFGRLFSEGKLPADSRYPPEIGLCTARRGALIWSGVADRSNIFRNRSALFLWHNRRKEKREILIGQTRIKAVTTDRENGLCELCLSVGTGVLDGPEIFVYQ